MWQFLETICLANLFTLQLSGERKKSELRNSHKSTFSRNIHHLIPCNFLGIDNKTFCFHFIYTYCKIVAWETKSTVKWATKKWNLFRDIAANQTVKPVLQHVRFSVTGCKKRNKTFCFIFSLTNKKPNSLCRHYSDNKVDMSNFKQFVTWGGRFTLSFSPCKVPLISWSHFDLAWSHKEISEFFMLTYIFHKNFQLPDWATRIWNLVAPMKFLVAPGNRAAVNVEPCIWVGLDISCIRTVS